MKKHLFLLGLLFLVLTLEAFGQNSSKSLSTEAVRFRNNLTSFLREEGFSPSVNSDGNRVDFKKEGVDYWINISGSVPVKLDMRIEGFTVRNANYLALLLACNEVNRDLYYVKSYVTDYSDDGNLNISIENPCHTAEEFRYVFFDCMNVLASARKQIQDSYNKNQSDLEDSQKPFQITSCSIGNVGNNNDVITNYGSTIYSYNTKYLRPKIEIDSPVAGSYTISYKLYTPDGSLSTGTNSPSGYSNSTVLYIYKGKQSYFLNGWGSNTSGHWKSGDYKIEFYTNNIQLGWQTFTIK